MKWTMVPPNLPNVQNSFVIGRKQISRYIKKEFAYSIRGCVAESGRSPHSHPGVLGSNPAMVISIFKSIKLPWTRTLKYSGGSCFVAPTLFILIFISNMLFLRRRRRDIKLFIKTFSIKSFYMDIVLFSALVTKQINVFKPVWICQT